MSHPLLSSSSHPSKTDSTHSFGVAFLGFEEQTACQKLSAALGAHGPE